LALVWGVYPELVSTAATYEEMFERGSRAVKDAGFAKAGDRIPVTAGVPFDVPGTTNLLRVEHV
ncbi:MAG TPA: pyruvate kinase alpha/beta domain-containing protein, partial [Gemmatimonadaceae bacterium]|nr:pyruvate kinase alpha/beta domain-containing protein [Gemmatimonadaceae bacterium]